LQLLKPTSFTPILALIGIFMLMVSKTSKKKDTAMILLGFATLMFGMDTMSDAVSGLADVPAFCELFLLFKNPILGVIVGAILTAVIQSSSASVGILQALTVTGQVSYGAAIPIIMGQNIGTCITALLSSFGANRNAKRAAIVHLSFNVIGTAVWLTVFYVLSEVLEPAILNESASFLGIAVAHSIFNVLCTLLLLPMSSLLEKLAYKLVPETKKQDDTTTILDERLFVTPTVALERSYSVVCKMANHSIKSFHLSLNYLLGTDKISATEIRDLEEKTDKYEDMVGTYLVKLSNVHVGDHENSVISELLKVIGDYERISDHSINILEAAEELQEKKIEFTEKAKGELTSLCDAVREILDLTLVCFTEKDIDIANRIEALEQVIDDLKRRLRNQHIVRLQNGECTVEAGFIWADLLTDLERVSDHCSNIAACVIDTAVDKMNRHESIRELKAGSDFEELYKEYSEKYLKALA
ncbi:MAG: Na/Pi cotransporter family protein, partial [Clostridia bacterium]|nr:Na/Pi cotransporter family protein [Clostridia bacterium]